MAKLTKKSMISQKEHTIDLPITHEDLEKGIRMMDRGVLIQNAFPMLNDDHREFILSGITPDEWEKCFIDEEDGNIELEDDAPAF